MTETPLPRSFFTRPVLDFAPDLLGRVLVRELPEGLVAVRLTEVEAYAGAADPGSHGHRGRTARNATMFGPPGHLYVYFTYGMHYCCNLVAESDGVCGGALLRAGQITEGLELARANRPKARQDRELARGPARLANALSLDRSYDGVDVSSAPSGDAPSPAPLRLLAGAPPDRSLVRSGPRTGLGGAGASTPWRFWIEGDRSVSPYRPHVPRKRGTRTSSTSRTS